MPKPTIIPLWATTGDRIEPLPGDIADGWLPGGEPPAENMNWLQGGAGDWCDWLNGVFDADELLNTGLRKEDAFSITGDDNQLDIGVGDGSVFGTENVYRIRRDHVVTVDATPVDLTGSALTTSSGQCILATAEILAKGPSNAMRNLVIKECWGNNGGTPSQRGTQVVVMDEGDASLAAMSAQFKASGSDVLLELTGVGPFSFAMTYKVILTYMFF